MESMLEQQFDQTGAPEEARPILNKYINSYIKVMENELGWEKMKDDLIDIYIKTYTEEEIRAISEFYKTPPGKKFIEKMPQLLQETMAITQKKMPAFMAKMQKISEEMAEELKQLEKKKKK